jgi:hypothetical protein
VRGGVNGESTSGAYVSGGGNSGRVLQRFDLSKMHFGLALVIKFRVIQPSQTHEMAPQRQPSSERSSRSHLTKYSHATL